MEEISDILNILGYIDNKFYLEDKEKKQYYLGGIPQNTFENYKFFSLKGLTNIFFKMEVKFDNGTIYETNAERYNISFNSKNNYIICFTLPFFNLLKESIVKIYDEGYSFEKSQKYSRNLINNTLNAYNFSKEMKTLFPNLTIILGNKILNLNKNNIFKDHDDIYTDLLIGSSPCDTIEFGKYFFQLFDYSEYDKDTEIVKMYLKKNNSVFKEIEENIDDIKYIKTSKFDILILCSIIFMVTIFDLIIINKDKNKNYPINYYEISLF